MGVAGERRVEQEGHGGMGWEGGGWREGRGDEGEGRRRRAEGLKGELRGIEWIEYGGHGEEEGASSDGEGHEPWPRD